MGTVGIVGTEGLCAGYPNRLALGAATWGRAISGAAGVAHGDRGDRYEERCLPSFRMARSRLRSIFSLRRIAFLACRRARSRSRDT